MTIKILVAGDLHIPSRASMVHPELQKKVEEENWDYIILTGDLTKTEVLESFYRYCKLKENVIACRGNMDQMDLPLNPKFVINGLSLGLFHGTGISPRGDIKQLKSVASKMNVRILFTGHSHQTMIHSDNEHLIINPGTCTGATGGSLWSVDTGLVTMEINLNKQELIIKSYRINNKGKLREEKSIINL